MNDNTILKCPDCKTEIPKCLHVVKIAGCPRCGCVATLQQNGLWQVYKKFTPLSELRTHKGYQMYANKQEKPLYLGKILHENGLFYTIYAIYTYFVTYEILDKDTQKWQKQSGFITEWYARSPTNDTLIFFQDTDKLFYKLKKTENHRRTDIPIYKNFDEFGRFELTAFGGVDDEDLDEKGHYRMVSEKYLLESITNDFTGKDDKLFTLKRLPQAELSRIQKPTSGQQLVAERKFEVNTFYRNLFAAALLILSGFMLFSDGSKWGRNDISLTNTEGVGEARTVGFSYELNAKNEFDTALLRPRKAGTFNLATGRTYAFTAKCFSGLASGNKDMDFSVSIVRKNDKAVVSDVDIGFFVESGRDDEGAWTEQLLEDAFKFQVDKSGVYEVFVFPDYDDLTHIVPCSLTISITETGYYYYYLILGSIFLLAFLTFQWEREYYGTVAKLKSGAYLHSLFGK